MRPLGHRRVLLLELALVVCQDKGILATARSLEDNGFVVSIEAVGAILMGGAICIAGCRFLQATAVACSFFVGSCATGYALASVVPPIPSIVSMAVGGLLGGGLAVLSRRVGRSFVGFCGGCAPAYIVYVLLGAVLSPSDPELVLLVAVSVLGCAGVASVWVFPPLPALIVASTFSGAGLGLLGLGHFVKNFPDAAHLAALRAQTEEGSETWLAVIPPAWWAYLTLFAAYSCVGASIQFQSATKHWVSDLDDDADLSLDTRTAQLPWYHRVVDREAESLSRASQPSQ